MDDKERLEVAKVLAEAYFEGDTTREQKWENMAIDEQRRWLKVVDDLVTKVFKEVE